jgi:hypothetical protein
MVRAMVRSVIHLRDNPEDALEVSIKRLGLDRDAAQDAYQMIRIPDAGADQKWRGVDGSVASHCAKYKTKTKPSEYMGLRFANEGWLSWGRSRCRSKVRSRSYCEFMTLQARSALVPCATIHEKALLNPAQSLRSYC